MIIIIHTAFGLIALITGAWNLLAKKGTRRHRLVGWSYTGSMIALIITSFLIFELFSGFGPYHIMSLVSGGALVLALYFPLRRSHHKYWLVHHYMWMSYSYIGLVMATGSHFFVYFPEWPYWLRAALFWGLPYLAGTALVYGQERAVLRQVEERMVD